jgi:hypothetical protein
MASRTQEPFPSFIEITSAARLLSAEVSLEEMHGIYQDRESQPPKGFHPRYVTAMGEELNRQYALVFKDMIYHLIHEAISWGRTYEFAHYGFRGQFDDAVPTGCSPVLISAR